MAKANASDSPQHERQHTVLDDGDADVMATIRRLVTEDYRRRAEPDLDERGRARLGEIRVELDQYWDLLRQRRARREFGEDPGSASLRPASVVERYEQ